MTTAVFTPTTRDVTLAVDGLVVSGELTVPADATGLAVLGFPTGNARNNTKHLRLTHVLNEAGIATLFCDLLTEDEAELADLTGEFRSDVPLLSRRLTAWVDWCSSDPTLSDLRIGVLGTGAGAAAAFVTAARRKLTVRALVVKGGRLDLAWTSLRRVDAPVLLVVGENDQPTREAYAVCLPTIGSHVKQIEVIPRAGAVFTDPVVLDEYAEHVAAWFVDHLGAPQAMAGWRDEVC